MNTSLKNGLVGAGIIGALAFGGYTLMGGADKASTESDTDYSNTRTNLSTIFERSRPAGPRANAAV